MKEFNVKSSVGSGQLQRILQEINTNLQETLENNHKNARGFNKNLSFIGHFSSGQPNLLDMLNKMDRKMEGLSKNYVSIFQAVALFAMSVIMALLLFILHTKFKQNRRVISLTEMSNLHMEHVSAT